MTLKNGIRNSVIFLLACGVLAIGKYGLEVRKKDKDLKEVIQLRDEYYNARSSSFGFRQNEDGLYFSSGAYALPNDYEFITEAELNRRQARTDSLWHLYNRKDLEIQATKKSNWYVKKY
ncbi:MAG: hypothetical protein LBJ18_01815 [Rickettsiales bacterium]|jgi:hypothetical protein|nr:hypothetical protein [Rickettsiales bacterium]